MPAIMEGLGNMHSLPDFLRATLLALALAPTETEAKRRGVQGSSNFGSGNSFFAYNTGIPWWAYLVTFFGVVGLIFLLILAWEIYKANGCRCQSEPADPEDGKQFKCYICQAGPITGAKLWEQHRRECVRRQHETLSRLPLAPGTTCPTCLKELALLPREAGDFDCRGQACRQTREGFRLENTGHSRYNCFWCDYDLCDWCVAEKREER